MITSTSLKHPTMQIKIKSCRTQAMMGLVGKLYNVKGKVIMVCVQHGAFEDFQEPTFYLVDSQGGIGKDVTAMILKVCPYDVYLKPKSFFQKLVDKTVSLYDNITTKSVGYVSSAAIVGMAFS